jgi:hypothetical protein
LQLTEGHGGGKTIVQLYFQANIVFPPRYFMYYWLTGIHFVLVILSKVDAKAHSTDATLALGAVCIYMLDTCFTRPAEGFGWEKLIETAYQQVLKDSDNNDASTMPILYDSGMYFICDIVLNLSRNRAFL